jgi:uncharacterized protein YndB with AHSA1/START domain
LRHILFRHDGNPQSDLLLDGPRPVGDLVIQLGLRQPQVSKHLRVLGVYREIVAPERIVATEKFDEAWYPGEAPGTTVLVGQDRKTTLTQTALYQSRDARDGVLKSGMESGVATSYDRFAELLASAA